MLTLTINERDITMSNRQTFRKGTVGAKCKIVFTDFWSKYNKTIVFKPTSKFIGGPFVVYATDMEIEVTIPWEVMSEVGSFRIGVYGTADDEVLPTLWSEYNEVEDATDTSGEAPQDPSPSIYQQILELTTEAVNISNSVREDANAGKFKGDKGDKGDPGKDAVTDLIYNPESENAQSGKAVEEAVAPIIENTNKSLKKQTRSQVVPVNNYDYNLNSVPYLYGNYGNIINHQETQGLIKASMGGIRQRIIDKINNDISSGALSEEEGNELITLIKRGIIPQQYREMLDYHTIAIKDGNAAIPVGYHDFKLDENENIIDSKLWYGAAVPGQMIFEKASYGELIPIARGRDNPNDTTVRGWDTGLQQVIDPKSETSGLIIRNKNPHAAELIEKYYQDIVKKTGLKVNPDSKQPLGALGLYTASFGGASSAQGKRAFACGTSTVAIGKYSFACGDNAVTLGNESFATGYNTVTLGKSTFAAGLETQAIGEGSVATGSYNTSNGALSFTGGQDCVTGATALRSFAYGKGLKTTSNDQFVIGKFNDNKSNTIFEVGNGSNNDNRSTAFAVCTDGSICIGNTKITEAQLQKLLALIN